MKCFLDMGVARSKSSISLCQMEYALDLLLDTGLFGAKPTNFPMNAHAKLTKIDDELLHDLSSY